MSFKEIIYKDYPTYDLEKAGKYLIMPLDVFTTKGYWWSVTIRFQAEYFAFPLGENAVVMHRWGKPERIQERDGMVMRVVDGVTTNEPCMCQDCVNGRKEVDAGWTPWGKKE